MLHKLLAVLLLGGFSWAVSAEDKPAETKPAETKPAPTKPAEGKAAETKPVGKADVDTDKKYDSKAIAPSSVEQLLGSSEPVHTFYGRAEAVMLFQSEVNSKNSHFVRDSALAGNPNVLSRNDLELNELSPGLRLTMGYQITDRWAAEGSYTGMQTWSDNKAVYNAGNETLNPSNSVGALGVSEGAFTLAAFYKAHSESHFNTGELNARYTMHQNWISPTLVFGLRYVDINQNFQLYDLDSFPTSNPTDIGIYKVQTRNRMGGAQGGADVTFPVNCWITVTFKGRLGALADFAEETTKVRDLQQPTAFRDTQKETSLAFMADVGAYVNIQPWKHVDFRLGYQALVVSGVSAAAHQGLSGSNASAATLHSTLKNDEGLIFHGPSVGVTVKF